mgnify:CR=1 FL=1
MFHCHRKGALPPSQKSEKRGDSDQNVWGGHLVLASSQVTQAVRVRPYVSAVLRECRPTYPHSDSSR